MAVMQAKNVLPALEVMTSNGVTIYSCAVGCDNKLWLFPAWNTFMQISSAQKRIFLTEIKIQLKQKVYALLKTKA